MKRAYRLPTAPTTEKKAGGRAYQLPTNQKPRQLGELLGLPSWKAKTPTEQAMKAAGFMKPQPYEGVSKATGVTKTPPVIPAPPTAPLTPKTPLKFGLTGALTQPSDIEAGLMPSKEAVKISGVEGIKKAFIYFPQLFIPGRKEKVIREHPREIAKEVETFDRWTAPFLRTMYPSKVILSAAEHIAGKKIASTLKDVADKHPLQAALSGLLGDIYNLLTVSRFTGGIGNAIRIPGGVKVALPTLSRYVPKAISAGTTFGVKGLLDEVTNEFREGRFHPAKIASNAGKNFLFGTLIAGPLVAKSVTKQIIGSGAVMGGFTALERYLRDGTLDSNDLLNIGTNAVLGMVFAALGVKPRVRRIASQEIYNFSHQQLVAKVGETNARLIEEAQLATQLAKLYPEKSMGEIMRLARLAPKGYTTLKLPTVIERQITPPKGVRSLRNLPISEQSALVDSFIKSVREGVSKNEPLWSAISKGLEKVGFPRIKEAPKKAKEAKPVEKAVKPSVQNTQYDQVLRKLETRGSEALTNDELDILAKGRREILTPEGKKPITPEDEAANKIIDMYAGFPLSKLAEIPVTFQGTRMSWVNHLGKWLIRYHGLTPQVKTLLVKLETLPELTEEDLKKFFMREFPVSEEQAKLLTNHQENAAEYPITPELELYAKKVASLVKLSEAMQRARPGLQKGFFPWTFIRRAQKEILQHQKVISILKDKNAITRHRVAIDQLQDYIDFLKGLRYVPRAYLQNEEIERNILKLMPENRITAKFRSSLTRLKGRRIATLDDAKALGLLPEEDIRILLASHFAYLYRKTLIYDVIEELKKNPTAVLPEDEAPDNWDRVAISQLSGYKVNPFLSAAIEDFAKPYNVSIIGKLYDSVNWLGKALEFINPIILPFWDLFQAFAAGSLTPWRPIYSAKLLMQAWKSVTSQDEIYHTLVEKGLFRTPRVGYFSPPIENAMRVMIDRLDKNYPKWKKIVERITGKPVDWKTYALLPDLYTTNWRLTWFLDRVLRTATFLHLKNAGMDTDDAVEYANNFHANYNIFTRGAKKWLNRIFLVPTYKANMLVNLYTYIGKNIYGLGKSLVKGEPPTPKQKGSLAALLRILILGAGVLAFAAWRGYHLREGYRLVKRLKKPELSKEGRILTEKVITLPGPYAEIPKFVQRIKSGPKGLYMYMAKVPQIVWGLARNARWTGDPYWTKGASPEYQMREIITNILKDYVAPVDRISLMTDEESDAIDNILSTFGLATYKRGGTENRILYQILQDKKDLQSFLKRPDISLKDKQDAIDAYKEKISHKIDELEDYLKTYHLK